MMGIFVTYCMGVWSGALLVTVPIFIFLERKDRLQKVINAVRGN
jgi:hypothetical protein